MAQIYAVTFHQAQSMMEVAQSLREAQIPEVSIAQLAQVENGFGVRDNGSTAGPAIYLTGTRAELAMLVACGQVENLMQLDQTQMVRRVTQFPALVG